MTTTEKRQLEKDTKELSIILDRINKLNAKYDSIKYNSNMNLLLNSLDSSKSILEDIANEN